MLINFIQKEILPQVFSCEFCKNSKYTFSLKTPAVATYASGLHIHVHLVCDIYCAHAYLCRCDSTPFCFWKLKLRRLIFRVNCRSNLTINIVNQAKKMKNEWLTMPTLIKENVLFDSKLSPGWFSVAEGAEVDLHDWNQGNWKGNILKSGREKLTDFCGTCHGKSFFQLVVTLCWLQFF